MSPEINLHSFSWTYNEEDDAWTDADVDLVSDGLIFHLGWRGDDVVFTHDPSNSPHRIHHRNVTKDDLKEAAAGVVNTMDDVLPKEKDLFPEYPTDDD